MEVKISFDTEKENIEDLKKLVYALQDLINRREGKISQTIQPSQQKTSNSYSQVQTQPQNNNSKPTQTAGGGKIVDYQDMSHIISKLASGKK